MRRETQNVLLILLGGALLKIALTGDYLRYVKPAQLPWVLAGGAVTLLLGAVAVVRDVVTARRSAEFEQHHHSARAAWLLLAPVFAVFLVAPPALGADSVSRAEARAPERVRTATFPPLPPGEVVPLSLSEFASRAGWDSETSLEGRTVSLIGFVVHDGGSTLLARLVVGCCAADAFPVTVRLDGGNARSLPSDTWLEVTGKVIQGPPANGSGYVPELAVSTLRRIAPPREQYEY